MHLFPNVKGLSLKSFIPTTFYTHIGLSFLIHIHRRAFRESNAVGFIEGFQIDFPIADARLHGYDSSQEFTVLARKETGQRQLVPAFLIAAVADFPDKVIE